LRSFYRDDSTQTGWNNLVFPNVSMPHVLWELQGQQALKMQDRKGEHGTEHIRTLTITTPGTMNARAYDSLVADLVNYLVFMGEPARQNRMQIGYAVLIFLGVLFVPIYLLKQDYWKEVH
jgi:ubiquinol-cytochrome c reductase cytochrome c1 subunit